MKNSFAFNKLVKHLPDISSIEYHENEWFIVLDTIDGYVILTTDMLSFWTKFWLRMFLLVMTFTPSK